MSVEVICAQVSIILAHEVRCAMVIPTIESIDVTSNMNRFME